jgi:hypothetical protein
MSLKAASVGRPRELRIVDHTMARLDPNRYRDVLKLLGLLLGRPIELRCTRGDALKCAKVKEGPCQFCIAEDRLKHLVEQADPWTVAKLNQILQLIGADVVTADFFDAFWRGGAGDGKFFKKGLARFRGYAMLVYGSFSYAFKRLGRSRLTEILQLLGDWGRPEGWHVSRIRDRAHGTTLRQPIDPKQTWHVGYLSSGLLKEDLAMATILGKVRDGRALTSEEKTKYDGLPDEEKKWWKKGGQLARAMNELARLETELNAVRAIGTANTTAYLAANHIDVYVATSMRERAEYEAAAKFLKDVRASRHLRPLKDVTFFDPTDSFASDRIDKGLVEALMLRRAGCTIYMVQETDTLGKDSELAATLALGKAVIAYVPAKVDTKIFSESQAHLYRRAAMLLPEGRFEPQEEQAVIEALGHMQRARSALRLGGDANRTLTARQERAIAFLASATIAAEQKALDNRAKFLHSGHPLALQVAHRTGVANGVLVVRDPDACAKLVYQALTFGFEFEIRQSEVKTDGRPSGTVLIERISACPFRVVTAHEVLTNSFWTRYIRGEDDPVPAGGEDAVVSQD